MGKKVKAEEVWNKIFPPKVGDIISVPYQSVVKKKHFIVEGVVLEDHQQYFRIGIQKAPSEDAWILGSYFHLKKQNKRIKVIKRSWEIASNK